MFLQAPPPNQITGPGVGGRGFKRPLLSTPWPRALPLPSLGQPRQPSQVGAQPTWAHPGPGVLVPPCSYLIPHMEAAFTALLTKATLGLICPLWSRLQWRDPFPHPLTFSSMTASSRKPSSTPKAMGEGRFS